MIRILCWFVGHRPVVDFGDFARYTNNRCRIQDLNWHCGRCNKQLPYGDY